MTNYEYGFLTKLAQMGRLQPGQERPLTNPHTDSLPEEAQTMLESESESAPGASASGSNSPAATQGQSSWLDRAGSYVKDKATATGNYLNQHPIGTGAAAGGIAGGLAGLLYEALRKQRDSMDRKDYLKRFLVGALIGTGAGGVAGVGIDQYRKSNS
jgi:hypothetical protein